MARRAYVPRVPELLRSGAFTIREGEPTTSVADHDAIKEKFRKLYGARAVSLEPAAGAPHGAKALKVGCVLSGGQAAGGHNCICGLWDYLEAHAPGSQLLGFVGGPKGVMVNEKRVLDAATIDAFRNSGGFTMLASGRDKIESAEQLAQAVATARACELDGLIVIGGDDSNTNAAVLAEHFAGAGLKTRVVGLPKTIDGDLKNEHCEVSFGFDTAAKLYAELVGNIMADCESSRKYYHFIRLMGREASHLTLEVALQTRPTVCLIGEEVKAEKMSLAQITDQIADAVEARAAKGRNYGVVLIPEGLVDFIPEMGALIAEINEVLARDGAAADGGMASKLSKGSAALFEYLPAEIREQLMLERDPHGNVQARRRAPLTRPSPPPPPPAPSCRREIERDVTRCCLAATRRWRRSSRSVCSARSSRPSSRSARGTPPPSPRSSTTSATRGGARRRPTSTATTAPRSGSPPAR